MVKADVVGGVLVKLDTAEFMRKPHDTFHLKLPLYEPEEEGQFPEAGEEDLTQAAVAAATDAAVAAAVASLPKRRGLIGRLIHKKEVKKATSKAIVEAGGGADGDSSEAGSVAETPRGMAGHRSGGGNKKHPEGGAPEGKGEVTERGERPPPGTVVGGLTLEVTYVPFASSQPPPTDAAPDDGSGGIQANAAITAVNKVVGFFCMYFP